MPLAHRCPSTTSPTYTPPAAHVADVAVDVATLAYRYAGGSAIDRDHPLHRAWRDAVTATQHVHTNDENYETWGEAISGFAANG